MLQIDKKHPDCPFAPVNNATITLVGFYVRYFSNYESS